MNFSYISQAVILICTVYTYHALITTYVFPPLTILLLAPHQSVVTDTPPHTTHALTVHNTVIVRSIVRASLDDCAQIGAV